MNSSSDLDKDRDGFSTHASEAKEKISSQQKNTGGIFGCFFCCGPKNNTSAGANRKRPVPRPIKKDATKTRQEKRSHLRKSETLGPDEE